MPPSVSTGDRDAVLRHTSIYQIRNTGRVAHKCDYLFSWLCTYQKAQSNGMMSVHPFARLYVCFVFMPPSAVQGGIKRYRDPSVRLSVCPTAQLP